MSGVPHVGLDNIRPGAEFFDASGRLRRTCARCGSVVPYGFGDRRHCSKKCKRVSPTIRKFRERTKMAGDTAYLYSGPGTRLYGRRVRRRRVRRGSGGSGKANGTPEEGPK